MQHAQRSNDVKDQLSNIIEERSEVHNMSSIKSSQLVQNIKINQQLCFICGEPNVEVEPNKSTKYQNILIYPCLCNRMAHRECMKKYLVRNQTFSCEVCKANYAVGKSPTRIFNHITPSIVTSWLGRSFIVFVFIVIMSLVILYISSFNNDASLVQAWKIVLIVLFGIVIGLMVLYVIFGVQGTLKKIRQSDIEVYCNQTEIGLHTKNTKEILKDYYENAMHYSLMDDYNMNEGNEEKEEIAKRQATNASILHTKEDEKVRKLTYEQELHNLDNILGFYDDRGEYENKRRQNYNREPEVPITMGNHKSDNRKRNIAKVPENYIPDDVIEEMSSIKVEKKDLTNNESFHSVNNVIEENMQIQALKKAAPNYSEQSKHKNNAPSQSEEVKEERPSRRYNNKNDGQGHNRVPSDLQKTVNQYEDIDIDFNIQPELRNSRPKINRERSLSLSLTNHNPVTYK